MTFSAAVCATWRWLDTHVAQSRQQYVLFRSCPHICQWFNVISYVVHRHRNEKLSQHNTTFFFVSRKRKVYSFHFHRLCSEQELKQELEPIICVWSVVGCFPSTVFTGETVVMLKCVFSARRRFRPDGLLTLQPTKTQAFSLCLSVFPHL